MRKAKERMKMAEEELEKKKEEIFGEWKRNWSLKTKTPFFEMFCCNYEYLKQKTSYNRRKNFFYKTLFVVVLAVGLFCYIGVNVYNRCIGDGKTAIFWESSVILLVCFAVCTLISKVLDIRKYQETWVRHSQHKFKIDMEMLKFLCRQKPYNIDKREDEFEKNILKIWSENHSKFVKNMETKEVSIMDGITSSIDHVMNQKNE